MQNLVTFDDYVLTFIQRTPHYAVKTPGHSWITKHKALGDTVIRAHLAGQYSVATLGRWYPEYAILDIDSRSQKVAEAIRAELGLNESNSMLISSESENSYHIIFRPVYNGIPPTLRLLKMILEPFCRFRGIEVYPQARKCIRLPYGPIQHCLDEGKEHLSTWEDKFFWFRKLDEFDLSLTPRSQLILPLSDNPREPEIILPHAEHGKILFEHGLQQKSSRNFSEYEVLYYLWRCNVSLEDAIQATWTWINKMHNGFSKDIIRCPRRVREEIKAQANIIYGRYDRMSEFPDSTHNNHNGFITKPDLEEIISISCGSLPLAKFTFHVVKYMNPRRDRQTVNVSANKLISWSSHRTYQANIERLEEKGILKRGNIYHVGEFSKALSLKWRYQTSDKAIFYDGRSLDDFGETCNMILPPEEFKALFRKAGASRQSVSAAIKRTYESNTPEELLLVG